MSKILGIRDLIPFSKETAILMMSDALKAASKSLNNSNFFGIRMNL